MKFELVDCCPVPKRLAKEVRVVKKASGATLNSCDRSKAAGPYLRKCGKSSQAELYQLYLQGKGNPANPPGRSTHERRSDGAAFAGPVGRPLFFWQVGMDWSDAPAVVRAASRRGWTATVTYPGNPQEGHHINFRRKPVYSRPSLKRGMRGRRVKKLTRALHKLFDPDTDNKYLGRTHNVFDREVEEAVKAFQRDHHQKADGIVGPQTRRQLKVALRARKRLIKKWRERLQVLRNRATQRGYWTEQGKEESEALKKALRRRGIKKP